MGTPSMNFMDATVSMNGGSPIVDAGDFQMHLPEKHSKSLESYVGKTVVLGLRPEDIHDKALTPPNVTDTHNVARFKVDVIEPMGANAIIYLTTGQHTLLADVDAETQAKEGQSLDVVLDANAAHVFDKETEQAIV
jgi:multiple sugar transport system ATP-binding protein